MFGVFSAVCYDDGITKTAFIQREDNSMRKALKIAGIIAAVIFVVIIGYIVYVFAGFHRIEDKQALDIQSTDETDAEAVSAPTGRVLTVTSYNIGFGAYSDDYTFFMDGGKESRARSVEDVHHNIGGAMEAIKPYKPDFALIQEIDIDGTRSWHIDERELVVPAMGAIRPYDYAFAQNYDSPYLMYPITQPHGANKAGILSFSAYSMTEADRRSLPIETGISKVIDLDRCYSKCRIPVSNGKELILYNMHLSAYTAKAQTAETQLNMVVRDMQLEYDSGNYCVAGGDFNRDLLGNSPEIFHTDTLDNNWAKPVNTDLFTEDIILVAPFDEKDMAASCRNPNKPYEPGDFVVTVDGFIVSANVEVQESNVIDTGFKYSDHNPVFMMFKLTE